MSLPKGERVEATGKPPESLPLSPEDFFVLSRVDGTATVREVIASSGLDTGTAEKILGRLIELGAIRVGPAPRQPSRTPTDLRNAAKQRRAKQLAAQMRAASGNDQAPADPGRSADSRGTPGVSSGPEPGGAPGRPAGAATGAEGEGAVVALLERVQPVAADDPRVDPGLDITVERQRRLLAVVDRLDRYTHFDVLGIEPTNDKKLLRRAYFKVSRDFHPDTYYGKKIGGFEAILDQLFKRAKHSYDLMLDDAKRTTYVQRIIAQRQAEQEQRDRARAKLEAAEAAERAAVDAEREAEAARRRELEALQRSVAAKEREARDAERRRRMGRRIAGADPRVKKAREHFEAGQAELEARRDGAAASLFRLALELDPGNAEYEEQYQAAIGRARIDRARRAMVSANHYVESGQMAEAARFYADAARALPDPINLSLAAKTNASDNPVEAHQFAMAAIEQTGAALSTGRLTDKQAAEVYLDCARAFQALGQRASAISQVDRARALVGDTGAVRALLNSLKVP